MEDSYLLCDNFRITRWKHFGYFGGLQEATNEDDHEFLNRKYGGKRSFNRHIRHDAHY